MLMNPSRRNYHQPHPQQQHQAEPWNCHGCISRESAQQQHATLPTISDLYSQLILSGLEGNHSACSDPHFRQAVHDYKKFLDYYNKMKRVSFSSMASNKSTLSNYPQYSSHSVNSDNCKSNVNTNNEQNVFRHDCKLAPFRYEENSSCCEMIKIPSIDQLTKQLIPNSCTSLLPIADSKENSMNVEKKRTRRYEEDGLTKSKKVKQNPHLIQISPTEILQSSTSTVYISKQQAKLFDSVKGTTCHQCKQKTLDIKTNCKHCCNLSLNNTTNGRGVFCSNCLKNRYGEEVCNYFIFIILPFYY
ncbi:predicted protein [Naegleria gruberi]|uniref:Predicted protein n=1 Tax=Naegleria gruberi TaxID=5762 RepID=D2VAL8_NAEGR|nr:uncharacterized protein NAEGRDRAFT_65903 [Naegleria gruberi]EFC45976.1 predicted protein [Naegleria gruberi]|eukprot:XP_002678720.1 predicted protein [Naegleria gruberi strain NEG-M]